MTGDWSVAGYAGELFLGWFGVVSVLLGAAQIAEWIADKNYTRISGKYKAIVLILCLIVAQALINRDLQGRVSSTGSTGICGVIESALDGGKYIQGWISRSEKQANEDAKINDLIGAVNRWADWGNDTIQGLRKYNSEWAESFEKSTNWEGGDYITQPFVSKQMELLIAISTKAGCS